MSTERQGVRTVFDMKLVVDFWRREPLRLAGLVLLAVVTTGFALAYPRVLGFIVDAIQAGLSSGAAFAGRRLMQLVVVLLAVGIGNALAQDTEPYFWTDTSQRFVRRVRGSVFRRLLGKGFGFLNRFPSGDVLSRLDADLVDVGGFASSGIFWPMRSILMLTVTLVILCRMNWQLTLFCAVPVSMMTVVWIRLGPVWDKWWRDWREMMSETNNFLESSYSGSRLVKAYVLEDRSAARFRQVLDRRIRAALRGAKMGALFNTLFSSISDFGALLVLGAGGIAVIRHQLTLGEFVAFNAYVQMLIWPMMGIGDMFVWIKQTGVEEQRVRELGEYPEELRPHGGEQPKPSSDIRLEDVSYGYLCAGEPKPALRNVTISIPAGTHIGIAGTVGSGKSTIARLMLRLAEPDAGAVRYGGRDLAEYDLAALRERFGYAPQEPGLFSATVRENILLGRPMDSEQLGAVIRVAQLNEDIARMPKGLEETIGEGGLRLSGGQRGRVAIARALYGKPETLVLDDITSSLDAETEQAFMKAVLEHAQEMTAVIVSHRLSILAACDFVYVLDAGRVVESGTHTELLNRRGLYWQLYHKQIAGAESPA
jgi:ATP-binding cassette, subfamily B, multidrug efflux pump